MKKRFLTGILTLSLLLTGCASPAAPAASDQEEGPPLTPARQTEQSAPTAAPAEEETPPADQDAAADDYAGIWIDEAGGGCQVEITGTLDTGYTIQILWAQEDGVCDRWTLTGSYDDIWQGIDYLGSHCADRTAGDGTVETETILAEETGLLYLDGEGSLLWEDTYEHLGDDLRFTRETGN